MSQEERLVKINRISVKKTTAGKTVVKLETIHSFLPFGPLWSYIDDKGIRWSAGYCREPTHGMNQSIMDRIWGVRVHLPNAHSRIALAFDNLKQRGAGTLFHGVEGLVGQVQVYKYRGLTIRVQDRENPSRDHTWGVELSCVDAEGPKTFFFSQDNYEVEDYETAILSWVKDLKAQ